MNSMTAADERDTPAKQRRAEEVTSETRGNSRWGSWTTWRNVGMVLTAILVPFGWLLPVAHFARVRAAARHERPF